MSNHSGKWHDMVLDFLRWMKRNEISHVSTNPDDAPVHQCVLAHVVLGSLGFAET